MIGIAPEELSESRDRERIASLAEVDVRRLIDVLRLERAGGRSRRHSCDRPRSRSCRCSAGAAPPRTAPGVTPADVPPGAPEVGPADAPGGVATGGRGVVAAAPAAPAA